MKKQISIEGMSCGHCVKHVERALKELESVMDASVNLEAKNAVVELAAEVGDAALKGVIEEAGYEVVDIKTL